MVEQHKELSFIDLKNRVKQGWTWEEFEAKYGLSKTRLKRHIRQNLCKSENFARGIIRDIDNNSRRKQKQGQQSQAIVDVEAKPSQVKSEKITLEEKDLSTTELDEVEEVVPTSDDINSPERSGTDKLAGLRWEEASQSKAVNGLEQKYWKQVDEYEGIIKKKRALETEYGQLQVAIAAKAKEYTKLCLEVEAQRESIKNTLKKKQEAESALADVRQQIADLETIKILAYRDGTLESLDKKIELDDTGYTEFREKLYDTVECQDILGKEINMLARLHCIVDHADRHVEVTFENEELEQIFTRLHSFASSTA